VREVVVVRKGGLVSGGKEWVKGTKAVNESESEQLGKEGDVVGESKD